MTKIYIHIIAFFVLSCSLFSCKKEATVPVNTDIELGKTSVDHKWYAFTNTGYEEVSLPQEATKAVSVPWTESIRICDSSTSIKPFATSFDAYFLVNRLGVLAFKNGVPSLIQDKSLFATNTACNLFTKDDVPFFTFYKNRSFNYKQNLSNIRPFLIRFQQESQLCVPLISYEDLGLEDSAEITGMNINENDWTIIVKNHLDQRNAFDYFSVKCAVDLSALTAFSSKSSLEITPITMETFRKDAAPKPLNTAPPRLVQLLSVLPNNLSYLIDCKTVNQSHAVLYESKMAEPDLTAYAVLTTELVAAVFADGTTFLQGAFPNHPSINGGKPLALRLPLLPKGYVYTNFIITGGFLVVAWEDRGFYETGRSGFLTVDMAKILNNF